MPYDRTNPSAPAPLSMKPFLLAAEIALQDILYAVHLGDTENHKVRKLTFADLLTFLRGNVTSLAHLTLTDDVEGSHTLHVEGASYLKGGASIGGDIFDVMSHSIMLRGDVETLSDVTVGNGLEVKGNTFLDGTLIVAGNASADKMSANGMVAANKLGLGTHGHGFTTPDGGLTFVLDSDLEVGSSTEGKNLSVYGNTGLYGSLGVNGTANFNGAVNFARAARFMNPVNFDYYTRFSAVAQFDSLTAFSKPLSLAVATSGNDANTRPVVVVNSTGTPMFTASEYNTEGTMRIVVNGSAGQINVQLPTLKSTGENFTVLPGHAIVVVCVQADDGTGYGRFAVVG